MSPFVFRRWAWLLTIVPAFGCATKDLRTVITEYKPKVEPQLAKLEKIRDAARTAPPVTADIVHVNGPPPKAGLTDVDEHVNVAVEYLEDLDDFSAYGNVPFRHLGSGSMNRCGAILTTHRYPYNPITEVVPDAIPWYVADDYLKHCAGVQYVFVIRSLAYAPPSSVRVHYGPCPSPASDGDETAPAITEKQPAPGTPEYELNKLEKCRTFVGGYLSAEVLVFDMTTTSQIGGFRYIAESSSKLDVANVSDSGTVLGPDFALKARMAFHQAAHRFVPSFEMGN